MEQADSVDVDLDVLGEEMLAALEQHDGGATTSELREYLGVDSRTKINYRITEFLAPQDLITTHQPPAKPGDIPPKELTLTEKGARVLDQLAQERELNRDAAERITRLEEQVQSLREENQELREQLNAGGATSSSTDEVEAGIESLQEQVGSLAMKLEDVREDRIFEESVRSNIDSTRAGLLAILAFLIEEHGPDTEQRLQELTSDYLEDLDRLAES
ncbi:hypothetical protein [Halobacterium salinarum]|uniref:hypothetical protein n=1 Tax=Halobacterium salinarum TaxID=2242 RepID=UPI001F42F32D|nr:hypothetical protein [Halobacterium salinarum]MCF2165455.1 hypothetical protein [Halobacterium salinarum]MCF2168320.1 hypothetical protein [Halobacterium salinarum]